MVSFCNSWECAADAQGRYFAGRVLSCTPLPRSLAGRSLHLVFGYAECVKSNSVIRTQDTLKGYLCFKVHHGGGWGLCCDCYLNLTSHSAHSPFLCFPFPTACFPHNPICSLYKGYNYKKDQKNRFRINSRGS